MIKAVFFDIDGTLVSFKTHRVPDSTKRAIAILRAKGIRVFIASGRQLLAINNLEDLQFDGYVTLNGGYCIVGEKVIYKHSMPSEDMVSLVRYMEEQESFPCIFVHENAFYINYTNERTNEVFRLLNFPQPPSLPLREAVEGEVFHFSRKNRRMRLWLPCLIVRQPGGIHCSRILFRKEVVSKWG